VSCHRRPGRRFRHERVVLLLVIGHPRRKRRYMPVQVSVALLATQAQAVHPLGRHDRGHRQGDPMHHLLQCQILRLVQVVHPVFNVPLGCDQAMAQQRRVPGQEPYGGSVLVNAVMGIVRVPGQDLADEARPSRERRPYRSMSNGTRAR